MLKQKEQALSLDLNRKLNVAYINICTETEGPYKRMAIWFQGCNILCEGCCNPELQEIRVAHIMTIQEILDIAIESRQRYGIEGITFLGGEPTLQEGLSDLASVLSKEGFGIILFTGKSFEILSDKVKNSMDIIVDGKYEKEMIDEERNLVGSKNQRIIFVSDRYKIDRSWFTSKREKKLEINLSENLFINGDVI
ncbi:4Fe-4S single cluster domain-containing protein [Peptostreptococcus stomatis]